MARTCIRIPWHDVELLPSEDDVSAIYPFRLWTVGLAETLEVKLSHALFFRRGILLCPSFRDPLGHANGGGDSSDGQETKDHVDASGKGYRGLQCRLRREVEAGMKEWTVVSGLDPTPSAMQGKTA